MTLAALNALPRGAAIAALRACCGAARWVEAMVDRMPFASKDELLSAADAVWSSLAPDDWREAFAYHPRIGERTSAAPGGERARGWSSGEQDGLSTATTEARAQLAAVNGEYERRFGYLYIVCASGRTAGEMLAIARQRLTNDPDTELRVAAEEQRKITRLRLEKLLMENDS